MADLKIPPISTLVGSTLTNFIQVIRQGKVHPKAYFKVALTGLICAVSSPFHWYEDLYDRLSLDTTQKLRPIFILGHWRSGTTHLHNLLCQDTKAGFLTTYQSLFPNNLHSQWIFKTLMKLTMPNSRPSDNMPLAVDLPQEDEFAIGNMNAISYYNFFYFPQDFQAIYEQSVRRVAAGSSKLASEKWEQAYRKMLAKAIVNTNGDHLIVKNPVNSGRIHQLLKMYPDAKFIHIYRNPIIVYLSTIRFFKAVLPALQFQASDDRLVKKIVLDTYVSLMEDLFEQQASVPRQNWIDLRFEDFKNDPLAGIGRIYRQFGLKSFGTAEQNILSYLDKIGDHQLNQYQISREDFDQVMDRLGFAMEKLKYYLPDNLVIDPE